ncbi:MAG: Uma2 family endonuclease [Candidatus Ozemobacteraceae bacterium]
MQIEKKENKRLFTYGDYVNWPDDERWEIIDGVPYDMTPAPNRLHQEISGNLFNQIRNFLEDKSCKVYDAPFDVRLPDKNEKDEDVLTVVQPDIVVVCDQEKLDDKGCRGSPDLAIEIISPFTSRKDQMEKFELYERHNVKEYWIVHPDGRFVSVYILTDGKYPTPKQYSEEDKLPVNVLPGLEINLAKVFPFHPKVVKESPRPYTAGNK